MVDNNNYIDSQVCIDNKASQSSGSNNNFIHSHSLKTQLGQCSNMHVTRQMSGANERKCMEDIYSSSDDDDSNGSNDSNNDEFEHVEVDGTDDTGVAIKKEYYFIGNDEVMISTSMLYNDY